MKNLILANLFLMIFVTTYGQQSANTPKKTESQTGINDKDPNAILFSKEEMQVLIIINQMRADPSAFYKDYMEPYIKQQQNFTPYYTLSLKKEMMHLPSLPALIISPKMKKTADYLCKDLLRFEGHKLTHTSSGGQTFEERMRSAGVGCAGENLYTGQNRSPTDMIMDLLIDEGVENFGHRKALLSEQYHSIGIAIKDYANNGQIMVQDFSCN